MALILIQWFERNLKSTEKENCIFSFCFSSPIILSRSPSHFFSPYRLYNCAVSPEQAKDSDHHHNSCVLIGSVSGNIQIETASSSITCFKVSASILRNKNLCCSFHPRLQLPAPQQTKPLESGKATQQTTIIQWEIMFHWRNAKQRDTFKEQSDDCEY